MLEKSQRAAIIRIILKDVEADLQDEDIVEQVLDRTLTTDAGLDDSKTFGQRAADRLARFAGSWLFIGIFAGVLVAWMAANLYMLGRPFDPYPFILLNLVLSCVAAIQAPLIMMSQNRQEQKDRLRNENDYKVNLKTEFIIHDLHVRLRALEGNQREILRRLPPEGEAAPPKG